MKLLMSLLFLFLLTCKSNHETKVVKEKPDCSTYNEKYVQYNMANKKDSALYYIDKAINCDPDDDFFKTEKIKLLIKYEDYSKANSFAKELANLNDPIYKMLYGVLLLRQGKTNAENLLKEAYGLLNEATINYNDENSNLHFYKIGLDNYFQGREYSLDRIKKFKTHYPDEYNIELGNYIETLIVNSSKEEVLFELFHLNN